MAEDVLSKALAILQEQQRQVQQRQAALAQASAPQQVAFRNPGQSGGDALLRGSPDQQRALLQMSLGMMGHDATKTPGSTISKSVASGFDILDAIRSRQREQGVERASGDLAAQLKVGEAQRAGMNAAAQMQFAENERAESVPAPDKIVKLTEVNGKDVGLNAAGEIVKEYGPSEAMLKEQQRASEKEAERLAAEGKAKEADRVKAEGLLQGAQITLANIDRAMDQSDGLFATGSAAYLPDWLNPQSRDLRKTITQVVSSVGFDRLQRMRDESPTGGALGQVSQMELNQLNAALGNLENTQSEDQLRLNLKVVRDVYSGIMEKAQATLTGSEDPELDQLVGEYQ